MVAKATGHDPALVSLVLRDATQLGAARPLGAADLEPGCAEVTLTLVLETAPPCCTRFAQVHSVQLGEDGRSAQLAWMCDPGPSFARCCLDEMRAGRQLVLRITTLAHNYASFSAGVCTAVDEFFDKKNRLLCEQCSVHGHVTQDGRSRATGPRCQSPEWCDGDVVKLHLVRSQGEAALRLLWWHNGLEQTPLEDLPATESWCYYVRGIRCEVSIEEKDLDEAEYAALRQSHGERLEAMKRAIALESDSD